MKSLFGALLFLSVAWGLAPKDAEAAPVCFYQHLAYGGASMCSDVGTFNGMPSGWNDYVTSVSVQSGYMVEIFEHSNLGGVVLEVTSDVSSLVDYAFNDMTSSYRITRIGDCRDWVSGTQYYTGDIVIFNGAYYVAEHDTSGTSNPTVDTSLWDPTLSCANGDGSTGFEAVVSADQFKQIFPNANAFYSYHGLVNAINEWGGFAGTGDVAVKKREAAAALANFHAVTLGGTRITATDQTAYCDGNPTPCGTCAAGKSYYGRGAILLSWNYNYCSAGLALGLNLWADPDQVAQNSSTAWRVALWYWMTQKAGNDKSAHECIGGGHGFGCTIKSINGNECDGNTGNDGTNERVVQYNRIVPILGAAKVGPDGC